MIHTMPAITQADRDAAADAMDAGYISPSGVIAHVRAGRSDENAFVQAFAQHRTAALLEGERIGMEKGYRSCAEMCRQMAGTIGALPGSSIYAALEACAERMDEIAIRSTGATK